MPRNQDLIDEYMEILGSEPSERFCPLIDSDCLGLRCMMFRVTSEIRSTTEGKTKRHPYGVCGLSFNPYVGLPENKHDV